MTKSNQGEKQFEGLLSLYLRQRQLSKGSSTNQLHLDEDSLSAFVEGSLTQQQAAPIIKHLINCIFCRRVTVQLAALSEALEDAPNITNTVRQNSWRELWNNLTESVSRSYDNAVIAHEEEKEIDEKQDPESGKK